MVNVKKGDLVRIEYTGRVASTGLVFDTTDESLARQAGIAESTAKYGPKLAVFGQNAIMQGMEGAIIDSVLGKKEEFLISADKAFGEKLPDLIRMLPQKEFAKQGVQPAPGLVITLDGVAARIKSVTSGRVVVDFNHPLAGESVLYSLKVNEVITEPKKKIEAILASFAISASVSEKAGKFEVVLPKSEPKEKLEAAKQAILVSVPGCEFTVQ